MDKQTLSPAQLAAYIDHTLLKPDASKAQIERLCAEAREHNFFSVCVNGAWVAAARHFLDGSDVKVASVVGFPLGAMAADVKRYETEVAVDDGAHEIDVVLNLARLGPIGERLPAPGTWGSVAGMLYFTVFFYPLGAVATVSTWTVNSEASGSPTNV